MAELKGYECDRCKTRMERQHVAVTVDIVGARSPATKLDLCNDCHTELLGLLSGKKLQWTKKRGEVGEPEPLEIHSHTLVLNGPCLDPDKMHGAGDGFGGSDY